jgi:hypothetical protein
MPRNSVFTASAIYLSLYPMFNEYCSEYFIINFITFVLSRFSDSLFAENHLLISKRTLFDSMQKSSKFLIEIMTLVSSANIMGIDEAFRVGGMSFT